VTEDGPLVGVTVSSLRDDGVVTLAILQREGAYEANPGPERALVVEDRATAIRQAIQASREGDIVLVAGKGHEAWQETRGQKVPFSDEAAVRAVLEDAA